MPSDQAQPDPADDFGPEEFVAATNVSRETMEHLKLYAEMLGEWNAIHNLVSKNSLAHVWRRHLLDSAQLARFVPTDARSLVDLGAGAGFPGRVGRPGRHTVGAREIDDAVELRQQPVGLAEQSLEMWRSSRDEDLMRKVLGL